MTGFVQRTVNLFGTIDKYICPALALTVPIYSRKIIGVANEFSQVRLRYFSLHDSIYKVENNI